MTSVSAFLSLHRGEAQQYKAEYEERLDILRDDTVRHAKLRPYTYKPYVLFFNDIEPNPDDWINRSLADLFGKESVTLED